MLRQLRERVFNSLIMCIVLLINVTFTYKHNNIQWPLLECQEILAKRSIYHLNVMALSDLVTLTNLEMNNIALWCDREKCQNQYCSVFEISQNRMNWLCVIELNV